MLSKRPQIEKMHANASPANGVGLELLAHNTDFQMDTAIRVYRYQSLKEIVRRVSDKMGVEMPTVGVDPSVNWNARAEHDANGEGTVIIGENLFWALPMKSLEAVVAHEVSHLREQDGIKMAVMESKMHKAERRIEGFAFGTIGSGFALARNRIINLINIAEHACGMTHAAILAGVQINKINWGIAIYAAMSTTSNFMPIVSAAIYNTSRYIMSALNRKRETRADADAVRIAGIDAAIATFRYIEEKDTNSVQHSNTLYRRLYGSHPPTEKRIKNMIKFANSKHSKSDPTVL